MACDGEDWGFQMLINDEIVTSVLEESDPVDDEMDEEEDNNGSSKDKKNSETLALSSSGIQKILELIFFATAIEKNVQQTVAAAITIVTTCNFTFRSHPPLSRKPRLSIYTGDVLVTSSTVMLRTLKNGTAALGNHSFTYFLR
ncbi:hypothetical protein TNCV_1516081 [Trichonephila clavipes]|nr:hypothetical protein TNCV_1516081 [Trichonephila clavipes]